MSTLKKKNKKTHAGASNHLWGGVLESSTQGAAVFPLGGLTLGACEAPGARW